MGLTVTQDLVTRIKPELIAQQLKAMPKMTDGFVSQEIFKSAKTINDTHLVINKKTGYIKSIPYVDNAHKGVARKNSVETDVKVTVPPMKIMTRVHADTLITGQRLTGKDFMAWINEEITTPMMRDKDFSLEYLKRSMLTTGNLSYPYLQGETWNTQALPLGTMKDDGTFTNLWSTAGTTWEHIIAELGAMRRAAAKTNTSYFSSPKNVKVWCPDAVFNALLAKVNGKQISDVSRARIVDEDTLQVGSYKVTRNPFEYVRPGATDTLTEAITAKQIRMVDVSAAAPHKMGFLQLSNTKAVGTNKHTLLIVNPDPMGAFIDVQLQFRPVPLFIPEASAKAIVLS